ncbi:polysaccharide deacetylase family protein [Azospira inquinata]|uniref:4-deoxy-4-formamido-L-arabinose-phosphoundecaprenol deformylase n=1 Tax=Azospira inquinata TaxID=2785627 RepID=A0A975XV28_9RHOO|nr:polysaccharide deacetylase family protein [Azospira inquinata]QWT45284.1 4-deoxy-4-formamido-L-arabinose-phosphoundecaprenol deformylase [Azospira inquinata]QWT49384.1 4-deoxy-4-formamido-L-arabinose-phosphoundecaprenol deformylase [Azospira inquinata]
MKLALKIDVDTYRGTRIGVPRLVELLQQHQAQATFLFSLGPDHTGRAIKRAFRPGFMKKVKRTSVTEHYGLLTLMYGTLLPGPDIGKRCAHIMQAVRDAGFDTGIHCWDHVLWQDRVTEADNEWTEVEMAKAVQRYEDIFGERPHTFGAAGWQMNAHALRLTQRLGLQYVSNARAGREPFIPVVNGEVIRCPELPSTLPTLDELIGVDGITPDNVADHLLQMTAGGAPDGHVYTLHAELEGMKLAPVFEKLLEGWKAQGYELVSLAQMAADLNEATLPRCEMHRGEIPGRSGTLMVQGQEFLPGR